LAIEAVTQRLRLAATTGKVSAGATELPVQLSIAGYGVIAPVTVIPEFLNS